MTSAQTHAPVETGGAPLEAAIASICNRTEVLVPGCRTGVCIASPDRSRLERSIFPNLPGTFQATIRDLPMGPPYIGCCTAAMDGDTVITVHDISLESRFSEIFIRTCIEHGIRALQSRPVYGTGQTPIGTFVVGYGDVSDDQRFDVPIMAFAADAVGALLQRELDRAEPHPARSRPE